MTDGIIISPNFPNHYDANAECVWVVIVPEGQRITLNFTDFTLESNTVSCNFDFVQVSFTAEHYSMYHVNIVRIYHLLTGFMYVVPVQTAHSKLIL